jgi:hypothetical protein
MQILAHALLMARYCMAKRAIFLVTLGTSCLASNRHASLGL